MYNFLLANLIAGLLQITEGREELAKVHGPVYV